MPPTHGLARDVRPSQVELLCKTVKDQQADLDRLQHENRLMKVLLQTFAKAQGSQ